MSNKSAALNTHEPKTKPMAQKIIDAWNTRAPEMIVPFYHPDYTGDDITGGKMRKGHDGIRKWINSVVTAFPNVRYQLLDYVEKDDHLVLQWEATGNHHGYLFRIPATGLPVIMQGMSILKLENGKVKEGKIMWDLAGVLRQLRLLPQMH